ncbi:YbaK/EbsC family protein [Chthonobacter albigriseus]|uniref:YbaK/EbsC family protein n=1 Tax=Chthonobacter albigriseus TaxID=1683161 RepID=UPI0015EEA9EB|nr:YbaK/EbsC family protein [Chthonobacter albigriseus]
MGYLAESARRVQAAASDLGLAIEIRTMAESTRTAEDAARACGTTVDRIVKSLVYRGATTGSPWLLLVSGRNRVDEPAMTSRLGEGLIRPDAGEVRALTGFAIGGIPPFGHASRMEVYMDEDLLAHPTVWAAAGTPHAVFEVAPMQLATALNARTGPVR